MSCLLRSHSTSEAMQHFSGGPFAQIKSPQPPTLHEGMDFHLCCLAQAKSPGTKKCSPDFSPTLGIIWDTLCVWSLYTTRTQSVLVGWSHHPREDNQHQGAEAGCCAAILASWGVWEAQPGCLSWVVPGLACPFPWDKSTVNCRADVFKASMLRWAKQK